MKKSYTLIQVICNIISNILHDELCDDMLLDVFRNIPILKSAIVIHHHTIMTTIRLLYRLSLNKTPITTCFCYDLRQMPRCWIAAELAAIMTVQ